MKTSMRAILRELNRRNIQFSNDELDLFRDLYQTLKTWKYEVGAVTSNARQDIWKITKKLDPKYAKSIEAYVSNASKRSTHLEDDIRQIMEKTELTMRQIK